MHMQDRLRCGEVGGGGGTCRTDSQASVVYTRVCDWGRGGGHFSAVILSMEGNIMQSLGGVGGEERKKEYEINN